MWTKTVSQFLRLLELRRNLWPHTLVDKLICVFVYVLYPCKGLLHVHDCVINEPLTAKATRSTRLAVDPRLVDVHKQSDLDLMARFKPGSLDSALRWTGWIKRE